MKEEVEYFKLNDRYDTEVRKLVYKGCTIRIETWKSLGYRQVRKSAEVQFSDGTVKALYCLNHDPGTFSAYRTNVEIFRRGKDLIRERREERKRSVT